MNVIKITPEILTMKKIDEIEKIVVAFAHIKNFQNVFLSQSFVRSVKYLQNNTITL